MEYRRKKEKRTNYRKRLRLLKSRKPRLVIRRTLRNILAQLIIYESNSDKTIVSAHSKELIKLGYKAPKRNLPTAYLVGALLAKKAREKSIIHVIPDIGFYPATRGSMIFSVLKGAKDGGLDFSLNESVVPNEDRIEGKHIVHYATQKKEHFLHYGINPLEIPFMFAEVKRKLIGK